ncbi:MAG: hypothetical protein ABIA93_06460 [Candidatus Woesearchaeota archaeon]
MNIQSLNDASSKAESKLAYLESAYKNQRHNIVKRKSQVEELDSKRIASFEILGEALQELKEETRLLALDIMNLRHSFAFVIDREKLDDVKELLSPRKVRV